MILYKKYFEYYYESNSRVEVTGYQQKSIFVMKNMKNNVFCTYVYDDIVGSNYRTAYYLWSFETFFLCK